VVVVMRMRLMEDCWGTSLGVWSVVVSLCVWLVRDHFFFLFETKAVLSTGTDYL
jgi:hypothetical protein